MGSLKDSSQYYHRVLQRIPPKPKPSFSEETMQKRVWGRRWGVVNDVGTLRMVLLHRPGKELNVMRTGGVYDPEIEAIINEDEQWYFRSQEAPNLEKMQAEHDTFVALLRQNGVEVVFMDGGPRDPNAMFTRDMGMVMDGGIIISRMGPVGKDFGTGRTRRRTLFASKSSRAWYARIPYHSGRGAYGRRELLSFGRNSRGYRHEFPGK